MGCPSKSLKVLHTRLCNHILDDSHCLHQLLLHLGFTRDVKGGEKVLGHGNQGILGPAAEPVHRATADETREFQAAVSKLLTHRGEAQNDVEVLTSSR